MCASAMTTPRSPDPLPRREQAPNSAEITHRKARSRTRVLMSRMAWQRRWWVYVWTGGLGVGSMAEDAEGVRQVHVDNVAALREVISELRTDSTVRRWTFGPFDELDKTDAPTRCRCGRELDGPRV